MQGYNCILVYSEDRSEILFCKRLNDPYEGMYNLVGGKIEPRSCSANGSMIPMKGCIIWLAERSNRERMVFMRRIGSFSRKRGFLGRMSLCII